MAERPGQPTSISSFGNDVRMLDAVLADDREVLDPHAAEARRGRCPARS